MWYWKYALSEALLAVWRPARIARQMPKSFRTCWKPSTIA
jgi:hypothetical protein